jgi:excisionase family DNA binding protein
MFTTDDSDVRPVATDEPLRLLTVEQACRRLQISRAVLYGLLNSGALRSFHIGRCRRIPVEALDELVAEYLAGPDGPA